MRAGDQGFESPQVRFKMSVLKDKRVITVVGSVLLGIVIIAIILFKYPFGEVISTFTNFTPVLVLAYLVVSGLIMLTLSFRWKVILDTLGHKVPFHKLVGYRIIGYGISYITPSAKVGGEPVRAALLKRQGLSFREGLSSIMIDKIIELSFSALFFICGVVFLVLDYALPSRLFFLLIILSGLFLYLVWWFYSRIMRGETVFTKAFRFFRLHKLGFLAKYQAIILNFEKPIIRFYKSQRKEFFITAGISLFSLVLSLVEYKLVLLMLGIKAPLGVVFLVFSLAGFAFLVPLPMALGSFEAFQVSLFSIIKLGPAAAGVGVAMITRSRDLLWVLGALVLAFYLGSFKNIISKAYKDKPVVSMGIIRNGRKHRLDVRINRLAYNQSSHGNPRRYRK